MSQTSFDKDKIKILLLEGVHASALERFHAAGYENIERNAGALQGDELAHALADVHIARHPQPHAAHGRGARGSAAADRSGLLLHRHESGRR